MRIDVLLGAPLDSSGAFEGCELAPAALRRAGLGEWPVDDAGNLQVVLAHPARDPASGVVAHHELLAASTTVRDAVADLVGQGRRPLLLGGDCSVLLGAVAGLRVARPGAGLITVDGHFDTHTGATSDTGYGADLEISLLLGDGPVDLCGLTGGRRVLGDRELVLLGARDHEEMRRLGSPMPQLAHPGALVIDEPALKSGSLPEAATRALSHLDAAGADVFWLNVDVDVLATQVMAAVDYPQPGGLDWEELTALVEPLVAAEGFAGMSLTVLNPRLDPGGRAVADTARWLADVLT